mmetsp:Transcript_12708/g.16053  ORF Transcript_12708/g.16053 Transcript_12708/m.16053 type:complete len:256 (+) Transcript_12708:56-823(+)|eukprot:CAMPEP_0172517570 /NCGR_PEP_ID=MMETSP1066-20121228/286142_1 /TAXON_ID=671091 /ORGANISM="Coscinodiscus wailesii, Strain CCMP2513" /LENGTH=255 /DNA_ID=CAMNT_0013299637 /DNA_START=43 /DNA_END=810 /DNA_ORIENTATION=+
MVKYSRPGVEGAVKLASEKTPSAWMKYESCHKEMITSKGGDKLLSLDNELDDLGIKIQKMKKPFVTKEELLRVVEWKFGKGKPRYALMNHLKGNSVTDVKKASEAAFRAAAEDDVKGAVAAFCELRGVGPATGSAVLCLYRPALFSFMDDEVIECLYEGKRGYTLKIYLDVNSQCADIAARLGREWSPYRVGRALWAAARSCAEGGLKEEIKEDDGEEAVVGSKKRGNGDARKKRASDEVDGSTRSSRYPKRGKR